MFSLNDAMDQLAVASILPWYDLVLWMEGGHVLRKALDFELEGQR